APVISGTVALMLEANKSLTPLLVKAILARTAQRLPGSTYDSKLQTLFTQGAGLVNAISAVEMALAIDNHADKLNAGDKILKGNKRLSSLDQSVTIGDEAVAASAQVLYSNGVLFSKRPILTNGIVLGDGIVL